MQIFREMISKITKVFFFCVFFLSIYSRDSVAFSIYMTGNAKMETQE